MPDKMTIHLVAGARPNFMKVGPLYHALSLAGWAAPVLVHTGQHYSAEMSDVFLRDLGLPAPDYHLQAGGSSHAEQTAAVLTAYESLCLSHRPDLVVVVGDINSTLAATLAAKKLNLPVAHLEAGLRSRDRTMPEEINRLMVDAVADILWTPSEDADANLLREGVGADRIVRVGNVMIDAYCMLRDRIDTAGTAAHLGLEAFSYAVVTMHRPINVDHRESLSEIVEQLIELSRHIVVVFPVHPRTRARLELFGLLSEFHDERVVLLNPLGYIEFMNLVTNSRLVITDSGGVQEETTYLGIPCLTARESTERPVTISQGSNRLISTGRIAGEALAAMSPVKPRMQSAVPLWDGHASERIVDHLLRIRERMS